MRIAVIGSGVSGIASAKTLARLGHAVTLYERSGTIGGVWAVAYPGVHLQNLSELYSFTDFPWRAPRPDYPSAAQIMAYLDSAVRHFGLDVRLNHEVKALTRTNTGWALALATPDGDKTENVDAVIVAVGNFTGEKQELELAGRDCFKGEIVTEHDIGDYARLAGKRVAVVGFGKSAVDMISFALGRAAEVHHVFRKARWLIPRKVFGLSTSRLSTNRMSNIYGDSWVHPDPAVQKAFAKDPRTGEKGSLIESYILRLANGLRGGFRSRAAKERLALVDPDYPVSRQFRGTLAPDNYYRSVAGGAVTPHRSAVAGFTETALRLADGTEVPCDVAVFAIGYKRPSMPFLPEPVRPEIDGIEDGAQFYRHVVHPGLPGIFFIGYSHNPLHIPTAEMASLWADAVMRGDLKLPPAAEMERSTAYVAGWKREHTNFEAVRGYSVSTHMHNYLDVLLGDVGLKSRRKKGNWGEAMEGYTAADYATIITEYEKERGTPRTPLPFDT